MAVEIAFGLALTLHVARLPAVMKRIIKQSAEVILGWNGLAPCFKYRTSGLDLVLGYHNVLPPGEASVGDKSLHIGSHDFREQIEVASDSHQLVPLTQMLEEPESGESRVAITFDDAYGGVVDHALPELARLGVPATVFVAPGFIGAGSFWWDALSVSGDEGLPDSIRHHALWTLGGEYHRIAEWARETGLKWSEVAEHARCASLESLKQAFSLPNIEFASHSWSHPNLAAIPGEQAHEELERSRQWLLDHDLSGSDYVAYPYGHETEAVRRIAAACGYLGGLKITGGWMRSRPHPFAIPRLNVPAGLSIGGFRLRMRGLLS